MKLLKIRLAVLGMFFVLPFIGVKCPLMKGDFQPLVFSQGTEDRLIWTESRGYVNAFHRTEFSRGLYQITPVVLRWYNWHNADLHKLDLYNPKKGKLVYDWLIGLLYKQSAKYFASEVDRYVFTINAYNMGLSNSIRGVYKKSYCKPVCGHWWELFIKGKTFRKFKRPTYELWVLVK